MKPETGGLYGTPNGDFSVCLDLSAKVNLSTSEYKEYESLKNSGYDYDELSGYIWSCLEEEPDDEYLQDD